MALKDEQIRQLSIAVDDYERTIESLRKSLEEEGKIEEEKEAIRPELERLTTARDEKLADLKQEERDRGYTRKEKILRYLKRAGIGLAAAGAIGSIISLIMNALDGTGAAVKKLGIQVANLGKKMASAIPGLLGSVLSLIFRTGGELLKFLGNNIWILVVALGAVVLKSLTEKR